MFTQGLLKGAHRLFLEIDFKIIDTLILNSISVNLFSRYRKIWQVQKAGLINFVITIYSMKTLRITIFLLFICIQSFGQDGSDIRYFKTFAVDNSLVGQYVHFDFYNRSFAHRKIDTVTITIDGKPISFKEVRTDDGFNNWFYRQYLQSIDKINDQEIRISQSRLDNVTHDSFLVTMFVKLYDVNNNLLTATPREIKYQFSKKDIVEVLVKSKQL